MNWRPRNETPLDLEREKEAARRIEAAWRVRVTKLSEIAYRIDWAIDQNDRLVAWGEFKCRAKRYDTLMISASKWLHGLDLANASRRPFLLFVQWPDGLHWHRAKAEELSILLGGNSRGQNGDIEPCIHIPADRFRLVK
jgi:hypothetical protein